MTLTFLGAAGTVTGSKFLLTVGERHVLVDAGLFQGEKQWRLQNWAEFPIEPSMISDVVLTHAHLDHCGYLPALVRAGFTGPIWATEGTRRLAEIVLRDAGVLAERDADYAAERGFSKHSPPLPLFTAADVERTLPLFRTVGFDTELDLGGGLALRMTRAGHILGAASVTLRMDGSSVLFSGDLGRRDHPVLRAREIPPGATSWSSRPPTATASTPNRPARHTRPSPTRSAAPSPGEARFWFRPTRSTAPKWSWRRSPGCDARDASPMFRSSWTAPWPSRPWRSTVTKASGASCGPSFRSPASSTCRNCGP